MNAFFERIYQSPRLAILFFLALSSFFFIGLGHVHLFDWDEINFAESAREMIASGDYLKVQINYEAFWEKPPFFFWLQVICMKVFGINEFAARFPNAVFGFIYLITIYTIGKKHFSAKFGMIWSLTFFASLLPHIYFKSGIIDPVFNFFIFMSIYYLILVVSKYPNQSRNALLAGLFSALAVLTKGPVGFLLLALTFGVYMLIRKFKEFPKVKYFLLFLVGFIGVVALWLSAEFAQNGTQNMMKFIEYQLELFNSGVAGHEQPFFYHFVVVFFGCFPMSIIALPALRRGLEASDLDFKFWMICIFWVVLILFSITTTKIIHYSSMTYLPLSFLAAWQLNKHIVEKTSLNKWLIRTLAVLGILLSIGMIAVPILLKQKDFLLSKATKQFAIDTLNTPNSWNYLDTLGGIVFLVGSIFFVVLLKKGQTLKSLVAMSVTLGVTMLIVLFTILPKVERMTQGSAIALFEELQGQDVYVETFAYKSYAQYFYSKKEFSNEPSKSLDFLLNGPIDKPAYLISKSDHTGLDGRVGFTFVKQEGAFKLYLREPN